MRKELYKEICRRLACLYRTAAGDTLIIDPKVVGKDVEVPEGAERLIKHIDLWNHNVEFIEQEANWQRPAVFVEFAPIKWQNMVPGKVYNADLTVRLHIVSDWKGSASEDSELQEEALEVFDLPGALHNVLAGAFGPGFYDLDLLESQTNHNHEEIIENIEIYQCFARMEL